MLYKTKDGQQTGFVPGVGEIVNGQIEGPDNLEGANLEKVEVQKKIQETAAPVVPPVSPPVSSPTAPPSPSPVAQQPQTETK